jgi:hypothetical protein
MTTFTDQEPLQPSMAKTAPEPDTAEAKHDGLTTPEQTENKRIPVPEQVEPEQPKRGLVKPVFLAEWLRGLFRCTNQSCETLIKE